MLEVYMRQLLETSLPFVVSSSNHMQDMMNQ